MDAAFSKRTFTIKSFFYSLGDMVLHSRDLLAARREPRIDRAFAERLMLAVTQVNDCRYCRFFHARMALRAGVSPQELKNLLAGDIQSAPPDEWVALTFAQHWAEEDGRPNPQARERLEQVYGLPAARQILSYLRMIRMGNLLGNSFDAILFRSRSKR